MNVSEAQGRVFFSLLTLPKDDLLYRPASAAAENLGLGVSTVHRHIAALRKAGLLGSARRYGAEIVFPSGGWTYHKHPPGELCLMADSVARSPETMLDAVTTGGLCIRCAPGKQMAKESLVKKMRGIVDIHQKKRGRPSTVKERHARLLIGAYTKERRKKAPGYSPTRGDSAKSRKVVSRLASRLIEQDLYRKYVTYAFEAYERIVREKYDGAKIPPVAFLSSETIIDGFLSTLGRREIDVEKAQDLLRRAGMDADPGLAVTIARNNLEEIAGIPDGLDEDLHAAVLFVIEHIEHIGYRPAK